MESEQWGEGHCLLRCSSDGQHGGVLKARFLSEHTSGVERWSEVETWADSPKQHNLFLHHSLTSQTAACFLFLFFYLLAFWCKIYRLNFVPTNGVCCLCRNVTFCHLCAKLFHSLVRRDCYINRTEAEMLMIDNTPTTSGSHDLHWVNKWLRTFNKRPWSIWNQSAVIIQRRHLNFE